MQFSENDINRFIEPIRMHFTNAESEIRSERKRSHWMWFIFPQLRGLGMSTMSNYYGISGMEEAKAFLSHPVLGNGLKQLCTVLMETKSNQAELIFGFPDCKKLKSSMTLFSLAEGGENIFKKVIYKFYGGEYDEQTLLLIKSTDHQLPD